MRTVLVCLLVILVTGGIYAYTQDPADCKKLLDDAYSVVKKISPITLPSGTATPSPAATVTPEPPPAVLPAPTATSVSPAPPPALPPIKVWTPPAIVPAQDNWTWTTLDGRSYQNVVVTKIEPDTVSITHSMGVAHIAINMLPPDIQKQLNYDPDAAAAARAESAREEAHPYYSFADRATAQSVAQQLRWPLAWVVSGKDLLLATNPEADSYADLTQMAMNHLKSRSVIIFVEASTELDATPPLIHGQIYTMDDGPMPGGHHFYAPKIVLTSPDGTKIFGRVSYTQMKATGALAIDDVLASIPKNSDSQPPSSGQTTNAPASPSSSTATVPPPAAPEAAVSPPTSAPAVNPSPDATKPWAPPDVMPAQPNWTWTTSDGTTYQNVVVTKIEPDTVTITHSMGVAHIAINLLPPDIQKQLNYDPDAAAAAHAESQREQEHPYYTMTSMTEAQSVAQQMHWPLAWVSSHKEDITSQNPPQDDETTLALLALKYLKDKSIIIFINCDTELGQAPPIVHHQFGIPDDGVLPGGADFLVPKVVFSSPDASKIFGRVSFTQMKASGTFAIGEVLASIPKDSDIPPPSSGQTTNAPAPSSTSPAAPVPAISPPASTPSAKPNSGDINEKKAPYHTEEEWIVASICRNAFEMLSFIADKKGEVISPDQVFVKKIDRDATAYEVTLHGAKVTVDATLHWVVS